MKDSLGIERNRMSFPGMRTDKRSASDSRERMDRRIRLALVLGGLAIPCQWPGLATGQMPGVAVEEGAISSTVFATVYARAEGGEPREIMLVVLWRGSPGWTEGPMRGTSRPSSAGRGGQGRSNLLASAYRIGDVTLALSFDPAHRVVRIMEQEILLGDDNVVLVDSVDTAAALRVAATLRIDPDVEPASGVDRSGVGAATLDMASIINRSATLRGFVSGEARRRNPAGPPGGVWREIRKAASEPHSR